MVFLFLVTYMSVHHARNLSYFGENTIASEWIKMDTTQIITWVYKDSLTLTYPPNTNTISLDKLNWKKKQIEKKTPIKIKENSKFITK